MSTENGALRQRESFRPEAGIASLATNNPASQLDEIKSKVHYIWNPFVDISLFGAEGLRMRLGKGWDYYGVGTPGDNFGSVIGSPVGPEGVRLGGDNPRPATSKAAETREEYDNRNGGILQRCIAYPIWNIYYKETKYNMGQFTEQENRAGNDLGDVTPVLDRQQFAGVCAADFLSRYREDYGARVLTPFIGMDGAEQETVAEIFNIVQPYAHPLTSLREEAEGELRDEETLLFDLQDRGPADARIRGAGLDTTLAAKAHELRRILRGGVLAALVTARRDWYDLLEQLGNTAKGHKGNKKGPSPYDRELAWLLKQPVPASIVMPQGDGELRDAVKTLTNVVAQQQMNAATGIDLQEAKQVLADIRAERQALEALRQSHTPETPTPKSGSNKK